MNINLRKIDITGSHTSMNSKLRRAVCEGLIVGKITCSTFSTKPPVMVAVEEIFSGHT